MNKSLSDFIPEGCPSYNKRLFERGLYHFYNGKNEINFSQGASNEDSTVLWQSWQSIAKTPGTYPQTVYTTITVYHRSKAFFGTKIEKIIIRVDSYLTTDPLKCVYVSSVLTENKWNLTTALDELKHAVYKKFKLGKTTVKTPW